MDSGNAPAAGNTNGKLRVAILGGGCAGVSAAFWLTHDAASRERFEVTLYTHGWRLGGKGASGRNADDHQRIQEHGLHLFMGFYENAFATVHACYDELKDDAHWNNVFTTIEDAFSPLRSLVLMDRDPSDPTALWEQWRFDFPKTCGTPGGGLARGIGWGAVKSIIGWLKQHLGSTVPTLYSPLDQAATMAGKLESGYDASVADDLALQLAIARAQILSSGNAVGGSLQESWFPRLPVLGYRGRAALELGFAVALGLTTDVLPYGDPQGYERIDHLDFKNWLCQHELPAQYAWSAPVRALYDLAFAYDDGDSKSESSAHLAAGATLKTLLRMTLTYKDAPLWKLNAGMGDVVFAPLYQVLRNRGVSIEFFHRVQNLGLSADGKSLDKIDLARQVDVVGSYGPLVKVNGLWCWPSEPRWDEIKDGNTIRQKAPNLESVDCRFQVGSISLQLGRDFDLAILAIPPAALELIGQNLLAKSPAIRELCRNTSSVRTQSVQLWRKSGITPPFNPEADLLSSYAEPFSSWAQMSHLLPREDWGDTVHSCEYLCGTMPSGGQQSPDAASAKGQADKPSAAAVEASFNSWVRSNSPPRGPSPRLPPGEIVSAYYRANVDPSELYIQTLPGSVKFRLAADGSGIRNLYLAGDWTRTSINGGSAEAAFESGRAAAEAIQKANLP